MDDGPINSDSQAGCCVCVLYAFSCVMCSCFLQPELGERKGETGSIEKQQMRSGSAAQQDARCVCLVPEVVGLDHCSGVYMRSNVTTAWESHIAVST